VSTVKINLLCTQVDFIVLRHRCVKISQKKKKKGGGNGPDVIHEQMLTMHDDNTTSKYQVRIGLSNLSRTDSLQR